MPVGITVTCPWEWEGAALGPLDPPNSRLPRVPLPGPCLGEGCPAVLGTDSPLLPPHGTLGLSCSSTCWVNSLHLWHPRQKEGRWSSSWDAC